jgi:hypothetical protein
VAGWDIKFYEPIGKLRTLADARAYILGLPKAEQDSKPWQTAIQCLLMAAEQGATQLAEIAMKVALNGPREQVFDPNAKKTDWGKRRKRDPWR